MRSPWVLAVLAYQLARERLAGLLIEDRSGLETARRVPLRELGLAAPNRVDYEPSPFLALRRGLRGYDVGEDDVFLDIGCGKGRVLLQAAKHPFRRVIGVEIAPSLADVARTNLSHAQRRCGSVEVVCADVGEYEVPDDVTVVYLFNPVGGPVFERAMAAIVASLDRSPRRLRLIYQSPFEHEVVVRTGRFRPVRTYAGILPVYVGSRLRVYESRNETPLGLAPERPEA